jgi:hypothetical protein
MFPLGEIQNLLEIKPEIQGMPKPENAKTKCNGPFSPGASKCLAMAAYHINLTACQANRHITSWALRYRTAPLKPVSLGLICGSFFL